MATVTTRDGTEIYYRDWGSKDAQPIVFHHGWPLSSDDWDAQMLFFVQNGYRVVAHDRRGQGRSAPVSDGHDMDHFAADAADVMEHLDLRNGVQIGHSTGGGEAARYVARFGEPRGRVAQAVLVSAVPPLMTRTDTNPERLPRAVFDGFRPALAANRAQSFLDVPAGPFYGFDPDGAEVLPGVVQNWWRHGMMGSAKAHLEGIKAFSETDQTEDLKAITVPTLVLPGEDDQFVPIAGAALKPITLLNDRTLKTYPGYPQGMLTVQADILNADLLAFVRQGSSSRAWRCRGGPAAERRFPMRPTAGMPGRHVVSVAVPSLRQPSCRSPRTGTRCGPVCRVGVTEESFPERALGHAHLAA